ncbi:beta-N-acetylhexosaminidase [Wenzhouxiangella sp. XN79A]|uniref:beta-N-acetylhexosaminidase n=1 Tax=Wenzhouxiangella sp. XN79A TaxID=2724193 RepID=UPI00144A626E|nr:beta-N-acetylhexosaminidase [Wenzhouxiangella sp. XN79A]NKI34413.1 beta-N-acetylhexosaminidase [Wenzhouxiangella sp. XN79A]
MSELRSGPLIVGIDGLELDAETRERLAHPAVGGVILFARNYDSPEQLIGLTAAIRALRDPRLLICVDQEGGRVQRFRAGFTPLPPLAVIGRWYGSHADRARDLAYRHGRIMAAEVLGHGVDLSLAPVLDLGGNSEVIGDRALAAEPEAVADLARYYVAGMRDAGMAACGKHFPGHGSVRPDSHLTEVVDERSLETLQARDLAPFRALAGDLALVMPAHVCYPAVEACPAGFSKRWLADILRGELGFAGQVVSDDLDMAGAASAGSAADRLHAALAAGCDLALVCEPASVPTALDALGDAPPGADLAPLYGRARLTLEEQERVPEFRAWKTTLKTLSEETRG